MKSFSAILFITLFIFSSQAKSESCPVTIYLSGYASDNDTGYGISGADVYIYEDPYYSTYTSASGYYSLTYYTYKDCYTDEVYFNICGDKTGYTESCNEVWTTVSGDSAYFTEYLYLDPTLEYASIDVSGYVWNSYDGKDISGAQVYVSGNSSYYDYTSSDGSYYFNYTPLVYGGSTYHNFSLCASHSNFYGYCESQTAYLDSSLYGSVYQDFPLEPKSVTTKINIQGTVKNVNNGQGISGIKVFVNGASAWGTSGSSGVYNFDYAPSVSYGTTSLNLTVCTESDAFYQGCNAHTVYFDSNYNANLTSNFMLTPLPPVDFKITVSGKVKTVDSGQPLNGTKVYVQESPATAGYSNSTGNYSFVYTKTLDAGTDFYSFHICAEPFGYQLNCQWVTATLSGSTGSVSKDMLMTLLPQTIGYFDVNVNNNSVITGWALDPNKPLESLDVHFYMDGPYGQGGTMIGAKTANIPRPDVNQATGYGGNHGFSFTIPIEHQKAPHTIYAYPIPKSNSFTKLLVNSPANYAGSLVGIQRAIVVGTANGIPAEVRVFNAKDQKLAFKIAPYGTYTGGVRVAIADVNSDGVLDVVTGPGSNGGPHVKAFSGTNVGLLSSFFAYNVSMTSGIYVATGDVNGDGKPEIITAPGAGSPDVRVFNPINGQLLHSWMAFSTTFLGGVRVAAADVNGDGRADVIVGKGPGTPTRVRAFSADGLTTYHDFWPYGDTFTGGVFVAGGDVNNDGKADIITGPNAPGGSDVRVWSGTNTALLKSWIAYPGFYGGVRVGGTYTNSDGYTDILTAPGPGGGPHVKSYSGADGSVLSSFFALPSNIMNGLFISGY